MGHNIIPHLEISLRLEAKGNNALFLPFLHQKITENVPVGRVIGENGTKEVLLSALFADNNF